MPSEEQLTADTLTDGQARDVNSITDGSAPEQDTAPAKLIFGKYKTIEEAEKGEAEKDKLYGRQAQELGALRAEIEALRQRSEMKEVLAALVNNSKPKEDTPAMDMDAFTQKLGDRWLDDPKSVSKELLGVTSHWVNQTEKKTLSEVEALRQELRQMREQTAEAMERMSPEYQQHKDVIDKMVAKGIPLSTAKELIKELAQLTPTEPPTQRITPPASITANRASVSGTQTPSAALFDMRNDLPILAKEFPDLNESQLMEMAKQMNANRLARMNAGEPVIQKSFKQMSRRN